jgi:CDP-6-deoxy-D-xylo-4-hexulose-3-dehydrase
MGRVQLRQSNKIKKLRKKNFDYLYKHLSKHETLTLGWSIEGADVCWFSFPITYSGDRGELVAYLEKHGIETRSMFSGNIIKHPAYANSNYRVHGDLPNANYILEHSLWLSCHPKLTKDDRKYIVDTFNKFFDAKNR